MQTTADITAMLGQATNEISQKRRLFVRSVLKDEYKDLTSITSETLELLFGDNLPQKIKDLNLRNKRVQLILIRSFFSSKIHTLTYNI